MTKISKDLVIVFFSDDDVKKYRTGRVVQIKGDQITKQMVKSHAANSLGLTKEVFKNYVVTDLEHSFILKKREKK